MIVLIKNQIGAIGTLMIFRLDNPWERSRPDGFTIVGFVGLGIAFFYWLYRVYRLDHIREDKLDALHNKLRPSTSFDSIHHR